MQWLGVSTHLIQTALLARADPLLDFLDVLWAVVPAPSVLGKHGLRQVKLADRRLDTVQGLIKLDSDLFNGLVARWNRHLLASWGSCCTFTPLYHVANPWFHVPMYHGITDT